MEDSLITLLESLKYPVIRQGSLAPDEEYPATFFTFWNNTEDEHSAYDNETLNVEYDFDVNIYSNNPALAYSLLTSARSLLRSSGWIITERGRDVKSDEITHIGRGMRVAYLNTEN